MRCLRPQAEDHLFEDKEVFVTSAYRKKLEEDKKWQEAERQKWVVGKGVEKGDCGRSMPQRVLTGGRRRRGKRGWRGGDGGR